MLKKRNNNQKGFTLVELIIVIAILGILAALLVPRIMGNVKEATRNKEIANARTIASEITTYNAVKAAEGKHSDMFRPSSGTMVTDDEMAAAPTEIRIAKEDFPDVNTVEIHVGPDGNAYIEVKP